MSLVSQPRVDLLRAEIRERRIDQGVLWKRDPVINKDRVDCVVGRPVPQLRVPLAAAAVVGQTNVHDLVGEYAFQLSGSQLFDECWIVDQSSAVRGHRGETRKGNEFQSKAKSSEEGLA